MWLQLVIRVGLLKRRWLSCAQEVWRASCRENSVGRSTEVEASSGGSTLPFAHLWQMPSSFRCQSLDHILVDAFPDAPDQPGSHISTAPHVFFLGIHQSYSLILCLPYYLIVVSLCKYEEFRTGTMFIFGVPFYPLHLVQCLAQGNDSVDPYALGGRWLGQEERWDWRDEQVSDQESHCVACWGTWQENNGNTSFLCLLELTWFSAFRVLSCLGGWNSCMSTYYEESVRTTELPYAQIF